MPEPLKRKTNNGQHNLQVTVPRPSVKVKAPDVSVDGLKVNVNGLTVNVDTTEFANAINALAAQVAALAQQNAELYRAVAGLAAREMPAPNVNVPEMKMPAIPAGKRSANGYELIGMSLRPVKSTG